MSYNNRLLIKSLELKSDEAPGKFSGFASVFNVVDEHGDMILPGAFADSIDNGSTVKLLWQHDHTMPIGLIHKLVESEHGLYIEGEIVLDIAKGNEAYSLLKKGVIDGLSIGYEIEDFYHEDGIRFISKLKLWEVSVVTFPANQMAQITEIKSEDSVQCLRASLDKAIDAIM